MHTDHTSDLPRLQANSQTAALDLLARGLVPVAVWPIGPDGRCACPRLCDKAGKHPIDGTLKGALWTAKAIRRAFGTNPDAGVGILVGYRSRIVVIDVDPRHGGHVEETADGYRVTGPDGFVLDLPRTMVQRTGGGGWHLFYTVPPGVRVPSRKLAGNAVELKGDGGFVVAAPSLHASGGVYQWEANGIDAPAPLPAKLLALWAECDAPPRAVTPATKPYATGSTTECIQAITAAVLARTGRRGGAEIGFCCPAHDDTHPSASWNESKRVWRCHACGAKGGYLDLARRLGVALPHPCEGVRDRTRWWRGWVSNQPWSAVDKAVALAILDDVERSGQLERPLSTRRVAQLAGVSRRTVGAKNKKWKPGVLGRLVARGMLRCCRKEEGANGRWFRLCAAPRGVCHQEPRVLGTGSTDTGRSVTHPDHDAYRDVFRNRGGLGSGCKLLYGCIRLQPMTKAELLAEVPKEKRRAKWRTLRRQHARLSAHGLACIDDRGRWAGVDPPGGWALLAQRIGCAGRTKAQRERYERERAVWGEVVATKRGAQARPAADRATRPGNTMGKLGLSLVETMPNGDRVDTATGEVIAEAEGAMLAAVEQTQAEPATVSHDVPAVVWALNVDPTAQTRAAVAFLLAAYLAAARNRTRGRLAMRTDDRPAAYAA